MPVVELFPNLTIDTAMDKVQMHGHLVRMANIHGYSGIDVDETHIAITNKDKSMILQFEDTRLVMIRKAVLDGQEWREIYNDSTPEYKKYDYYEDVEYAWLRVPIVEVEQAGIQNRLSSRSRIKGDFAYLENKDMDPFIEAKKWDELESHIVRHVKRDKHSIRGYDSYKRQDGLPYA